MAALTVWPAACDDGAQLDGELLLVQGVTRDLKVLSVRPDSGPLAGGTLLVMTGEGFEADMTVTIGGGEATQLFVGGDELAAMATPPALQPGTVDVVVTRPSDGASATVAGGFTYVPSASDLLVTEVIPGIGPLSGGNVATVAGQGFDAGSKVWFGGKLATGIRLLGPDAITLTVPPGDAIGAVTVRVESADGGASHSLDQAYAYQPDGPQAKLEVLSVIPSEGPLAGGNVVTIDGNGFVEGAAVRIGGEPATDVRVLGINAITCTAPAGAAPGLVEVRVELEGTDDNGTRAAAFLDDAYRYRAEEAVALSVLAVIPAEGPLGGGNLAAVRGTGFEDGAKVFFGGVPATQIQVLGDSALTAKVPAATVAGIVDVRVQNPPAGGTAGDAAALTDGYTYHPGEPDLLVLRAIPNTGPVQGGTVVALEGTGFTDGAKVFFGGAPATEVQVLGPTALTVRAPVGASAGLIDIRVELPKLEGQVTGDAYTLTDGFTYLLGGIVGDFSVASLFPTEDDEAGGALVLITGTGFDPAMVVRFGDTQSPITQVLSASAATALVPAGSAGLVDVTLVNPDAQVNLTNGFRYTTDDTVIEGEPPALGAVAPGRGPTGGGTIVRVVGTNFDPDLRVFFGDTEASDVHVISATSAAAVVPAADAGAVSVRIVNPDDREDTLSAAFVYADPADGGPTASGSWPSTGPSAGGTWVSVDGDKLLSGSTVWFGLTPASTRHVTDGQLVGIAPPGEVGSVDLTVVRADGAWARMSDAFAYYDINTLPATPPVVASVFPSVGDTAGGESVAVIGNDFEADTRLFFDSIRVSIEETTGATQRIITTPVHAAGSVSVTAVNANGLTSTRRDAFVYFAPPPLIIGVSPGVSAASGGAEITVSGKNFVDGSVIQLGDQTISTFNSRSATALTFFAPSHEPATLDVMVRNPDGQRDIVENALVYVSNDLFSAPVVTSIDPQEGLASGGYLVVIRGDNFLPGVTVKFDGVSATKVTQVTPQVVTAQVPPGEPGVIADVSVANSTDRVGTLEDAFTYTAAPVGPLKIRAVAPGVGPVDGGTVITVTGEGFEDGSAVFVGGEPSPAVAVISPTVLTALTPAGQDPGLVDVRVQRPDFTSAAAFNAFAYYDPATYGQEPGVFSVDPVIGPLTGGTAVMITGQRFSGPVIVFFGAREATRTTVLDSGRIVARTPISSTAGTVAVSVINVDGLVGVLPGAFSYYDAAGAAGPVVGGLVPSEGSVFGGDDVTVVGQRMSSATRIYICERPAIIRGNQEANVLIETPAGDPGPCLVTAVNSDGLTDDLDDGYKYVSPNPVVDDVVPKIGPIDGGIDVVVQGDNFVPGAAVRFGNAVSPVVLVADATTLTARLPASSLGVVDITVINPGGKEGSKADAFEYVDSVSGVPPNILGIVPATGPLSGGTPVQVVGNNFDPQALLIVGQKTITNRAWISTTEIRFNSPPASASGSVPITVLNPDGLGSTVPIGFTYATPTTPPPEITSVVPSTGREAGGTTITLTGRNFDAGGSWTLGGIPLNNVATVTQSLVTARTPAGVPGKVDLVYVGPDGQVALRLQAFEYLAAPDLTGVTPPLGNIAGGAEVTLVGDHFASGMEVFFGSSIGQILSVQSEATALARAPSALISGFVDVTVRNPDGQEAVLDDGFEYLDSPTFDTIWPPNGPGPGGTLAWIEGDGFHSGSRVFFGPTESTEVHYQSRTLLLAFTPAGTFSSVDVRVLNPDGREVIKTGGFQYTDPATLGSAPFIGEIFPSRGPTTGGTRVSLDGAAFHEIARVAFLAEPAAVDFASPARLIVVAPAHPPGPAKVYLTNPDGQTIRALDDFTFLDPSVLGTPPVVGNVDPTRGPTSGATEVTLIGNHFQTGARVRFGPRDGQVTADTAQQIKVLTPPSPAGPAAIWVVNPDGTQALGSSPFLFLPPPNILAVSPKRAPASGGIAVTLSGTDFATDPGGLLPDVIFCTDYDLGTACVAADPTFTVVNSAGTQLSILAPAHVPALVDVAVLAPDGQFDVVEGGFTFSALPTIVNILPSSGPTAGGTEITVKGTNFQQGLSVRLGGELCTETRVEDENTILCKTPEGAAGAVDVVVTNLDTGAATDPATTGGGFTYVPPPSITGMIPNVGPEDADPAIQATITGFNFQPGLQVFVGATEVPADDITVNGSTTITFVVPSAGRGSNDVKVINPDGQVALLLDGFTYIPPLPPPSITFITPPTGSTLGGDQIKIAGQHFLDGVRVYFGKDPNWIEATSVDVRNNGTLIVGLSPAYDAGVVDVRVENTDGQADLEANVYEFIPPAGTAELKFLSIEPTRSILAGGGRFTLSGEGFKNGVQVRFVLDTANVTFASNIVRLGPTLLTGTLPPAPGGVSGNVTVRLVNPASGQGTDILDAADAFEYVDGPVFVRHPGDRLPNEPHNDSGVVIFDANKDDLNDVLVFNTTIDRLLINGYEGRKGHFAESAFATDKGNFSTIYAVAKDFDEDGDIDIIRHKNSTALQFCPNDGGGSFPTCIDLQSHNCTMRRFVAEDFNCDGHLDLFLPFETTSSSCQNRLLVGLGDGTFVEAPEDTLPLLLEKTKGVAAADVDSDNDIDLLLANDDNVQSRLYLNNCANLVETGDCAQGIPRFDNYAFAGSSYAVTPVTGTTNVPTSLTWDDARAYCERRGYQLVRVDSQAENDFLRALNNWSFWLGLHDQAGDEVFTWIGGDIPAYTDWCDGDPNTPSYDCAMYQYSTSDPSRCWADSNCASGHQFICELDKPLCAVPWQFSDVQYGDIAEEGKIFPIAATNARDALLLDINDDDLPDAIIGSWGQGVDVYINIGGRFKVNDDLRWPTNESNPYVDRLIAADLEDDGDIDIITKSDNFEIRTYANQFIQSQFASFADETPIRWPNGDGLDSRTDVVDFAVGDLDDDLLPDVYLTGTKYADRLVMNRGYEEGQPWIDTSRVAAGVFRFNTYRAVPERLYDGRGAQLGDLDGVNGPDIVKCGYNKHYSERLVVYFNDGAGKFIEVTDTVFPEDWTLWCNNGRAIKLIDLDGDDDLDIVYEGSYHWSTCRPGEVCSGRLQLVNRLNETGRFEDVTETNMPYPLQAYGNVVHMGDFDLDGDMDMFTGGHSSGNARFFINGGDVWNVGGTYFFDTPEFWEDPSSGVTMESRYMWDAVTVDLDGDPWPDVFLGISGKNRVYQNMGGEWFDDVTVQYANTTDDTTRRILIADFDQDLDDDLMILNSNQPNRYLQRQANDYANITASAFSDPNIIDDSRGGDVGDLDLDDRGLLDVVIGNHDQQNRLWLNQGSGQFLDLTQNMPWDQMYTNDMFLFDIDGDGDLDIYFVNEDQDRVYMNTIIP